jgi:hypothetical protein
LLQNEKSLVDVEPGVKSGFGVVTAGNTCSSDLTGRLVSPRASHLRRNSKGISEKAETTIGGDSDFNRLSFLSDSWIGNE